jgi:fumarate hydratase class II
MAKYRTETDTMGVVRVPAFARYGAQTARAAANFRISGERFPRGFIRALGLVKAAAARVNFGYGLLDRRVATAIERAAHEVTEGRWDGEFVLDVFQTGSGTSTNMNANEVIANRANELLGRKKGPGIGPNDTVNKCQSSNDVIPTAIHLAVLEALDRDLTPALDTLARGLEKKAREFGKVVKTGRTHLQDAVPVTLGQEFSGWATQVRKGIGRIRTARINLLEIPIGGTALGTGLNAPAGFGSRMSRELARTTSLSVRPARNRFEAIGSRDALVEASGALKTVAVSLIKIASDIRLLASGPRAGIGEIILPELQPGSSIMPGKVNPVIPEVVIQVGAQVIGNDAAVTCGGMLGQLELNAMMPLIARNILESAALLANAARAFNDLCIAGGLRMPSNPANAHGIAANRDRCRELLEKGLMPVTALAPKLGYQEAARIAKEAARTGRTVREIALGKKLLPAKDLDRLLDFNALTRPGLKK